MDTIEYQGEILEVHKTYHDNGKLKWEWTQKRNQLHGYRKEYFESGNKRLYGEYKNGKRYKFQTVWFENGEIKQEIKESKNLLISLEYDKDGNLICQSTVNHELKVVGKLKRWYSNGNLHQEINYNHLGKPTGISKVYHMNGSLALETEYTNDKTKFINQINEEGNYSIKNGNGMLYNYNLDKSLASTCEIQNGTRNGKETLFKEGQIHCESNYINGKTEGPTYWYYPNGKIKEIIHMRNGIMEKAERNFPMYDNPVISKSISIKPSERRLENNEKFIPGVYPELMNLEDVLKAIDLTPDIYNNKPQDLIITEVYRVNLNKEGKVTEFTRSVGSGYPVTEKIEKSFSLMQFDMKNQSIEGVINQIWITFKIKQIEKE